MNLNKAINYLFLLEYLTIYWEKKREKASKSKLYNKRLKILMDRVGLKKLPPERFYVDPFGNTNVYNMSDALQTRIRQKLEAIYHNNNYFADLEVDKIKEIIGLDEHIVIGVKNIKSEPISPYFYQHNYCNFYVRSKDIKYFCSSYSLQQDFQLYHDEQSIMKHRMRRMLDV